MNSNIKQRKCLHYWNKTYFFCSPRTCRRWSLSPHWSRMHDPRDTFFSHIYETCLQMLLFPWKRQVVPCYNPVRYPESVALLMAFHPETMQMHSDALEKSAAFIYFPSSDMNFKGSGENKNTAVDKYSAPSALCLSPLLSHQFRIKEKWVV